jgi:hypothetical protein
MLFSKEVVMRILRPRFHSLRRFSLAAPLVLFTALATAPFARSQSTTAPPPPAQTQQPPDQTAPDAGGPTGDSGVIALPKKKEAPDDTPPPAPAAPKIKNPEGMPNYSLHIDVPEVTVDVGVLLEKTHTFVPGLKPTNFRVYEDGVAQKVSGFKRVEAPITALMICEFAAKSYSFIYDMRNAAFSFAQQLRPQDYVALMTFDLHSQIQLDFTQDKRQLMQAIDSLRIPGFSETDVFDALYDGLDRLERIEGRKYIILIASGVDSFSKLTLDKILKRVKAGRTLPFTPFRRAGSRAPSAGAATVSRFCRAITR